MSRSSAYLLVISFLLLTALGFVMLLSTAPYSQEGQVDGMNGVRRQGVWLLLGLIAAGVLSVTDYHNLRRWAGPLFGVAVVLLVLCFVPGVGVNMGGSSRWIGLQSLGFKSIRGQPSELARIIIIISLAAWCAKFRSQRKEFLRGFVYPILMVALPTGLIAAEVDLGTASLVFLACTGMLFIAGARWVYVIGLIMAGAILLAAAIHFIPNRMARITAFTHLNDPEMLKQSAEINDKNHQQIQSKIALGAGGLSGQGLGESRQKLFYLPLPHTDFIFAIIGEEGGLAATLGVILLFLIGGLSGMIISLHAPDRFGQLLGFGLMSLILGQACINVGVTTGCLPNKGMPLPFISYGGSNLFSCLVALGIVLNIYLQARESTVAPVPFLGREKLTPAV